MKANTNGRPYQLYTELIRQREPNPLRFKVGLVDELLNYFHHYTKEH